MPALYMLQTNIAVALIWTSTRHSVEQKMPAEVGALANVFIGLAVLGQDITYLQVCLLHLHRGHAHGLKVILLSLSISVELLIFFLINLHTS